MINAYVYKDAMRVLAKLESSTIVSYKRDIRVEFIDAAPVTAEVEYDGEVAEISMYIRDEMHSNGNMGMHGIAKGSDVDADEGDEETVKVAYDIAEKVNKLLQERGMLDECAELDEDMQGVLFGTDKDDDITIEIVEGKKRPLLLCTTLFGAPQMMRPYFDEIMSQLAMGSMSFEELEEAANAGDVDAMEKLAMSYLNGDDDIDENPEKAYYWFVKCAEAGNAQAMFNVGLFTAKGFCTERDFVKAAEWMQKAADEGDEHAESCADEYRKLAVAVEKAKAGDAQAQADLAGGLMKLGGSLEQAGAGKDYEESVMWAEKAVAQGCADGYWTLALAYQHGRGVDEDMDKAIEIYKNGADAGNAPCQHNLGCGYMSGINLEEDSHKGFELIKAAAEQGYGPAMRDIGKCYQFANGTPYNMKAAIEWYEKALDVIDDPELEKKVQIFKTLDNIDEDYSDEDEDFDLANLPDGYMDALGVFMELDEYEEELEDAGIFPDIEADDEYPRVKFKASEGDERAIELLKRLDEINGIDKN